MFVNGLLKKEKQCKICKILRKTRNKQRKKSLKKSKSAVILSLMEVPNPCIVVLYSRVYLIEKALQKTCEKLIKFVFVRSKVRIDSQLRLTKQRTIPNDWRKKISASSAKTKVYLCTTWYSKFQALK